MRWTEYSNGMTWISEMIIRLNEMKLKQRVIRNEIMWKSQWCQWQYKLSENKWHYMKTKMNWNDELTWYENKIRNQI